MGVSLSRSFISYDDRVLICSFYLLCLHVISAMYSGLMECPCTDKIKKVYSKYDTIDQGACDSGVETAEVCFEAVSDLGLPAVWNNSVSSAVVS